MQERMRVAANLIREHKDDEALKLLQTIDHPKAREWERKLGERLMPVPDPSVEMFERKPAPPLATYRQAPPPPTSGYSPPHTQQGIYNPMQLQAQMKSFTGHLVATIILYFALFIPGMIANIIFYNEGKRMEAIAGTELPDVRGLSLLRQIMFGLLLAALVLLIVAILVPLVLINARS